jgi:LPXTG-motif cell wall-anchored protein
MEPEPKPLELLEPPDPSGLLPESIPVLLWLGIAIGLLLLAALVLFLRRRKAHGPSPAQLRDAARNEAAAALAAARPRDARDAAVQVSLILRRYLTVAAADPSLFETHEEFITRADSLAALNPAARETCAERFAALASLKYGRQDPLDPPESIVTGGTQLLETLHRGFAA